MTTRSNQEPVAGVLIVDKPRGMTSFDVVAMVRRAFRTRKVGHAGTLDPLATGVLIMLLGDATKLSEVLMTGVKEYQVSAVFGLSSDTMDYEGRMIKHPSPPTIELERFRQVLPQFRGWINQLPPMFSAVHYQGRRLYELARKGVTVERTARTVQIHELELLAYNPPDFTLRVACSSGTYIRSLVVDLAAQLQTTAVVTNLRRTKSAGFPVDQAVQLDSVRQRSEEQLNSTRLMSPEAALSSLPSLVLKSSEPLVNRRKLSWSWFYEPRAVRGARFYRVFDATGNFLAVVEVMIDNCEATSYSRSVFSRSPVVRWLPRQSRSGRDRIVVEEC